MNSAGPLCVLVVGDETERAVAEDALRTGLDDVVRVVGVDGPGTAVAAIPDGHAVTVTVLLPGDRHVDGLVDELAAAAPELTGSVLLLTSRDVHDDIHRSLDADLIQSIVRMPWAPASLTLEVAAQIVRWLRNHAPDDPRVQDLRVDRLPFRLPRSDLLRDLELDEHEVSSQLVAALDRALGPRPRLRLPAGTRLSHQDVSIDGIVVVLEGTVALDRSTEVGELRLHHATTGPMVGLLALAQQSRAFFTARATTDVEVLHVSLGQLDLALRSEPEVGAALAAVSLRVLAQRLKRSEDLQIERVLLNRELETEQARLQAALSQLEAARLELVESARFATLGELAAGVAHELNNPVAALTRAANYLVSDLSHLLAGHPGAEVILPTLEASRNRVPRSTADERAARDALAADLGDRELARRLVAAGITDATEARRITADDGHDLELIELSAGLGSAARNLEVASSRIAELVTSLRAYARPSTQPIDGVDIHATLEDTLRLVAHRLPDADVERVYGDDVPSIRANPGELSQVWTNLIVNAAESLEEGGQLRVVTDRPDPDSVRVRIEDDGPGLSREAAARAFEPRFTTKQGTVRYGLGLGLAIAKRIVDAHGGRIDLDSEPGRTVATVQLPVHGPAGHEASHHDRPERSTSP